MSEQGQRIFNQSYQEVQNQYNVAGDYIQYDSEFFATEYTHLEFSNIPHPPVIDVLLHTLNTHHLVMLSGDPRIDIDDIARRIAWELQRATAESDINKLAELQIKEWYSRDNSLLNLNSVISQDSANTIFVLPEIEPQHLGHSITHLKNSRSQNCFIIATTKTHYESWVIPGRERQRYWRVLDIEDAYPSNYLAKILIQELNRFASTLPIDLPEDLTWQTELVTGITIGRVVQHLQTPGNIEFFTENLRTASSPVSIDDVRVLIENARENQQAVSRWYYHLDERQKLFAVALGIFDGLFDDQLFGSLEFLVSKVWRSRDPSLVVYDYHDLEPMSLIYRSISSTNEGIKIESQLDSYRDTLLALTWRTHRRYIISILPVLAELTIDSVHNSSSNRELFGYSWKRNQIRTIIGNFLSDIARISSFKVRGNRGTQLINSVEDTLVQLAANESAEVQNIAAVAMARWRESDNHDIFFNTLTRWQTESRIRESVGSYLNNDSDDEEHEQRNNEFDYVRATIAITVSHAVLYDNPNKLPKELYQLIEELSKDDNALVRDRFCEFTLPRAVSLHVVQLEKMLRRLILNEDFLVPISRGLAFGRRNNPKVIEHIVSAWLKEAEQLPITEPEQNFRQREAMLATIVLAHTQTKFGAERRSMQMFNYILANKNEHPFVRNVTTLSVNQMAKQKFSKAKSSLAQLVPNMTNGECDSLVDTLTEVYLEQRASLSGGEKTVRLEGKRYNIWIDTPRPLTEIEMLLQDWVKCGDIDAQQVGFQCFVSFAKKLDKAERDKIEDLKSIEKQPKSVVQIIQSAPLSRDEGTSRIRPKMGWIVSYIMLFVSGTFNPRYRKTVLNIARQAHVHNQSNSPEVDTVLAFWRALSDQQLNKIAGYLKRILDAIESSRILIAIVVIFITIFIIVILNA